MSELLQALTRLAPGVEVSAAEADLNTASRDTSIFERRPQVVAFPKNKEEVASLVRAAASLKAEGRPVSLTARAAGTCMSGGPLSDSIVVSFTKYMNAVSVCDGYAETEPGAFYRDFEKETLKQGLLLPSYPASRSLAAMGGIVNNDSGGERTLEYGKTRDYVESIDVVLNDGTLATFGPLLPAEVEEKKQLQGREGEIYRGITELIDEHKNLITTKKPKVSKNSAGYALWDVMQEDGSMNLAKLITGAQGTLALMASAKLRLVKPDPERAMLIVFMSDLKKLPEVVKRVLAYNPESFESYDDHTLGLALRFLPQMLSQMGFRRAFSLSLSFIPEALMALRGGLPKLVLMAEFSEASDAIALSRALEAKRAIADLKLPARVAKNEAAAEKYWIVRRESFSLLRKNLSGLYAAPFIDDFVVPPETYPEFLPKLDALLAKYDLIYTIAGHIGNGNFHIIPLMDLSKESSRKTILELSPKVYDLVIEYGGTTTGEHNDGIIRTPYLPQLFGDEMVKLFTETKRIFDPENIFNPGKKVGGSFEDIERSMLR